MKQALVMLYPDFCYFEVAALTEILAFKEEEWTVTTVGADRQNYLGEDGLQVLAEKSFSQVDLLAVDLLILPGIDNYHVPLADSRNVAFLRQLNTASRPNYCGNVQLTSVVGQGRVIRSNPIYRWSL